MRNITIFTLALMLGVGACGALEWTYGGSEDDEGYSVVQTADGGYAIAGYTDSFGAGNSDAYLIKTTATGDTQWTRTFGGSDDDVIYSMAQTSDGGYILAGWTGPYDAHDIYIVKVSATGDVQWTKTYGGARNDEANSVVQTSDGGYIVAGFSESFDEGAWGDVYLLKLNSLGDTVWTRTYGGIDVDIAYAMAQTSDGGYILTGYTNSFPGGDIYLLKIAPTGDTLWTRTYAGDVAYAIAQTSDGGYIIAGWIDYLDYDVYIIKTTATGDTQWTKIYGGVDEEEAYSIAQTSDGGYILAGYTSSYGAGDDDVFVLKLDSSGDTLWTRTFGGTECDCAQSVAQTTNGGYIIAGYTESFGAGGTDAFLVKTDSMGYAAIDELPTSQPKNFTLNTFPNPFNSSCAIATSTNADVKIYDLRGNLVGANPRVHPDVVNAQKGQTHESLPTSHTFIWSPDKSITSGIYFVQARTKHGMTTTKRIVYLR